MTKTEEFIEKARKVHGDKYDYSKVEYVNSKTKVKIICPVHGEFEQTPNSHLIGRGCRKCKSDEDAERSKIGTEKFIERSINVHGNKYDYSKVVYVNIETPVTIICPIHGEFLQRPLNHLQGYGCKICGEEKRRKKAFLTTEEFIEKARKIHGDRYDYSKVEYKNNKEKVCIICPVHGEFWQAPNTHLCNHGCPKCNASKLELEIMRELDSLGINYIHLANKSTLEWIGRQSLDFYLPDYRIGIECQGEQHYKPVKHFGGYGRFIEDVKRDERKRTLCEANNVNLLYFDGKNKEQLLEKILCLSKKR